MVRSRASVTLENFLRITVVERNKYNTACEAAQELGMTEASFKQRLQKERKNYPVVFENVPKYRTNQRRVDECEAMKMVERLKASTQ